MDQLDQKYDELFKTIKEIANVQINTVRLVHAALPLINSTDSHRILA